MNNSSITILVIEDNEALNLVIKKILEHEGYKILQAYSAKEGMQKLIK